MIEICNCLPKPTSREKCHVFLNDTTVSVSVSVSVSFISAPPQEKQKEINKHIEL